MKTLKEKVIELEENQKHILEAIKYLDGQLKGNIEKNDIGQINDFNNILESQSMIDQLIVKNSDDIVLIKKTRRDNSIAIRDVESKIDTIEKEIQSIQSKLESSKEDEEVVENVKEIEDSHAHKSRKCKHFNTGFCKLKDSCSFGHKSLKICESHRNAVKCENVGCEERHPKPCRYLKRGYCWRKESCAYDHDTKNLLKDKPIEENDKEKTFHETFDIELESMESTSDDDHDEAENTCVNCNSSGAKNQCEQCMNYICSGCEITINGESILEYFKSFKFINYTCNTTHLYPGSGGTTIMQ